MTAIRATGRPLLLEYIAVQVGRERNSDLRLSLYAPQGNQTALRLGLCVRKRAVKVLLGVTLEGFQERDAKLIVLDHSDVLLRRVEQSLISANELSHHD